MEKKIKKLKIYYYKLYKLSCQNVFQKRYHKKLEFYYYNLYKFSCQNVTRKRYHKKLELYLIAIKYFFVGVVSLLHRLDKRRRKKEEIEGQTKT